MTYYENINEFFEKTRGGRYFYLSKKANKRYCDVKFADGDYLVFGKETKGLPEHIVFDNPETALRIPMANGLRSLNLSNTVALVLYEALRQTGFDNLV